MKLEAARKIGRAMGLTMDGEHVQNILHHTTMLFLYADIKKEVEELIEDAKKHGVPFAKCGCADIKEGRELCYTCLKFRALEEEEKDNATGNETERLV